jgi:hypothetical protein
MLLLTTEDGKTHQEVDLQLLGSLYCVNSDRPPVYLTTPCM